MNKIEHFLLILWRCSISVAVRGCVYNFWTLLDTVMNKRRTHFLLTVNPLRRPVAILKVHCTFCRHANRLGIPSNNFCRHCVGLRKRKRTPLILHVSTHTDLAMKRRRFLTSLTYIIGHYNPSVRITV